MSTSEFVGTGGTVDTDHRTQRHGEPASPEGNRATARDPVCGMHVDPTQTRHRFEHDDEIFSFCCARCRDKFQADPDRYLGDLGGQGPAHDKASAHASGVVHTCPMHPEVRQVGAGACPICGMALEPEIVTADAGPNVELIDMTRRLWIGGLLALPLLVLDMGGHALGLHRLIAPSVAAWLEMILATPVVFWAGLPFFARGWASVRTNNLNMFTLIALGTGVAWAYSALATVMPGLFPTSFREPDGSVAVYFEAAALITVLALVGQVLELHARERTGSAVRALIGLAPKTARRIDRDDHDEEVPLHAVTVGDRLRLRPGDTVPVDGKVADGRGTFDESMLTGEAMPVAKTVGDTLIAGTLVQNGSLVMQAEKVGHDTMLAQIVALVAKAQRSRAPIQRLADRVAAWFVPAVVAVAASALIGWSLLGPEPRVTHGLVAAVSVLIIACPCALGLATPMAIMVGIGRGAGAGILFRDAEAIERLAAVDTVVMDKTGTLTEGKPRIVAVSPKGNASEPTLLRLCASLERASGHPLATAFVAAARERGLVLSAVTDVEASTGEGIEGTVEGHRIAMGNWSFVSRAASLQEMPEDRTMAYDRAVTLVHVAIDRRMAGSIALADAVKPAAAAAVHALREQGIRVVMLTGDGAGAAGAVAEAVGIADVEAGLLPQHKAAAIDRLRAEGRVVAMLGDGVNDGPALAAADVGIAMGTGADVAIESAGITLLEGDLARLATARALAHATMRNIRQNLVFAFGYNAAGVPIAAGILYPLTGLLLSPVIAAAAMALSSVSVIANALRLRTMRLS